MARADRVILCSLPLAKNAMHSPTSYTTTQQAGAAGAGGVYIGGGCSSPHTHAQKRKRGQYIRLLYVALGNYTPGLLTLGAHAQRGLQYLVCPSVRLLPRFLPPRATNR